MTLLSSYGHQHLSMIHHCLHTTIILKVKESIGLDVMDSIILARLANIAPSGSQSEGVSGQFILRGNHIEITKIVQMFSAFAV